MLFFWILSKWVYIVFLVLNWISNLEFRRPKKLYKLSKLGGGNLDKIQKNSTLSSGERPFDDRHFDVWVQRSVWLMWSPCAGSSYYMIGLTFASGKVDPIKNWWRSPLCCTSSLSTSVFYKYAQWAFNNCCDYRLFWSVHFVVDKCPIALPSCSRAKIWLPQSSSDVEGCKKRKVTIGLFSMTYPTTQR